MLTRDRTLERNSVDFKRITTYQFSQRRAHQHSAHDIIVLFRRHSLLFFSIFFVGLVATVLTTFLYTKIYTATSAIVFDRNDARPYEAVVELRKQERDKSVMETELDVIQSRVFVGTVVDALALTNDPDYNTYLPPIRTEEETLFGALAAYLSAPFSGAGNGPEMVRKRLISEGVQRNRAISTLLNSFTVNRRGDSLALTIRVRQPNPLKAAKIADAIAEYYVGWTAKVTNEATKTTIAYLQGQAKQLADRIANMEREIAVFATHSDLAFDPKNDWLRARMDRLTEQLAIARSEEVGATARYAEAKTLLTFADRQSAGRVLTSEQLDHLRNEQSSLERERAELTSKFGKNHPLVIDKDAELDATRRMIGEEAERIVQELGSAAKIASVRADNFENEAGRLQKQIDNRTLAEIRRREFERDLLAEQKRYDQIVLRLGGLDPERGERKASAKVASYAEVPTTPSFPTPSFVIATGILGVLALAVIGVLIASALDTRLYQPGDVEELLNRPNLVAVPDLGTRASGLQTRNQLSFGDQDSVFARAMRNLCRAWETIEHSTGGKVVMFCSAASGEGKTTIALGMAASAKSQGLRAVIIDFDAGPKGAGSLLGVRPSGAILSKFLEGQVDLGHVISTAPSYPFLDVISARPNLSGLDTFYSELRGRYDLIIIDPPALELEEDSIWLASQVDSVIMVVAAGRTKERDLIGALNRLSVNHPVILGGVLNFHGKPKQKNWLSRFVKSRDWAALRQARR